MTTIQQFMDRFERFCPETWRYHEDPVGLHFGKRDQEIHHILTTLDVRPEVVDEAIELGCDFIVAHHPVIFHRPNDLTEDDPQQAMYAKLIRHHIGVYCAHTNLDAAPGGMNDWLAEAYGIIDTEVLVPNEPATFTEDGKRVGMGRIGRLVEPMRVRALVERVKAYHHLEGVRVVSADLDQMVQRVAVLGGDGGSFYHEALAQGAEVYITGDAYYHTAHDMLAAGLTVIDPGHHMESICKDHLTALIQSWAQKDHWQVTVRSSIMNTDPFTFL
ncbi:MAG: Nif3-like dinuclear metal center hexameric protein [Aerococcus sp.]|nr:Nif3-like dinuclear metal center hexameric protein [Aerococcus sp.]